MMSEIRYDRLHDCDVIIAPERLHRPDCLQKAKRAQKHAKACPFCEGNEALTPPEIFAIREAGSFADEPGWKTRVVPNLYKAVQIETPDRHHYGAFEYWDGFGAHEVIIDTPKHKTSMMQWDETEVVNWLKTLSQRVADLRGDRRIAFISLFKNEGVDAGATQPHSHTQLIGLPIVPKLQRDFFAHASRHFHAHKKSPLTTMIEHEESVGERIIASAGDFTAFCPFASAYPFEVIIGAKTLCSRIDDIQEHDFEILAPLLLQTLAALERQMGCVAFNMEIVTPPLHEEVLHGLSVKAEDICRFMIRIMPRIYRLGGFELSTQMIINPVAPETAAKLLRESING
jgi:UDPglucose--hexose-1-phosphate uridylyltransferase